MFKIIIIDDDVFSVNTMADILPWNELGFELDGVFTNSVRALEHIRYTRIDVIITDICMEEPNGLEIVKKCEESYPQIKIILLSAYRNFEYARLAVSFKNVIEYLTKPLNFEILINILKRLEEQLTVEEKYNKFLSEEECNKRLEFFSNILYGTVTDIEKIQKQFIQFGIQENPVATPCTIMSFHVEGFKNFVTNVWKHSSVQLFRAINNAVQYENKYAYCSLASYSYGNLVFFVIHKPDTSVEDAINLISVNLTRNLGAILKISITRDTYKTFDNLKIFSKDYVNIDQEFSGEQKLINSAIRFMNENYSQDISLSDVAYYVYMSPAYFSTYFKKLTGEKFIDRMTKIRLSHAAEMLKNPERMINEISKAVGYNNIGNFNERFKKYYNMTPTEYRNKYVGERS